MKTHTRKPDNKSRTAERTPKASQQAPASEILKAYSRDMKPAALERETKIPNRTGLPDDLKAGVENLSGYSMDDVQVHYNSNKPAQLHALAYTQGSDIYVGPGQEKHLPHEAWHAGELKQGGNPATIRFKGMTIGNDDALEKEADVMGEKAKRNPGPPRTESLKTASASGQTVFRYVEPWGITNWICEFPSNFVISDDGTAAAGQNRDQYLYATPTRMTEANQRLTMVRSPVRLEQTAEKIDLPSRYGSQTINKLLPKIDPAIPHPNITATPDNVITGTPADCMKTAEAVVGKSLHVGGVATRGTGSYPGVERLNTLAQMAGLTADDNLLLINLFAQVLLADNECRKLSRIWDQYHLDPDQEQLINLQILNYTISDPPNPDIQLGTEYISIAKKDLSARFDTKLAEGTAMRTELANMERLHGLTAAAQAGQRRGEKMDKFADPDYGEAYASVSGGNIVPREQHWNYHWGGIIMKTDTDNVTLENNADWKSDARWVIRMYGRPRPQPAPAAVGPAQPPLEPKPGQSWHEQWSEHDFGTNPSTLTGR